MNEPSIYPAIEKDSTWYYVEFNRGGQKNHFTLFKRQFWTDLEIDHPVLSREGHPFQILDGFFKEGGVPDRKWVEWMVDQLNAGIKKVIEK